MITVQAATASTTSPAKPDRLYRLRDATLLNMHEIFYFRVINNAPYERSVSCNGGRLRPRRLQRRRYRSPKNEIRPNNAWVTRNSAPNLAHELDHAFTLP